MKDQQTRGTWAIRGWGIAGSIIGCAIMVSFSGGCQQWSTYPPVEVTSRLQRPAAEPLPTIIADSIKYTREHYTNGQDLPINLPTGMPASVYDKVIAHLGAGQPMQSSGEKAVHITEVRTRGFDAAVDLMYPRSDTLYQPVTLTLQRSVLAGWRVIATRTWQYKDATPPGPNFTAPPVEPENPDLPIEEPAAATASAGG